MLGDGERPAMTAGAADGVVCGARARRISLQTAQRGHCLLGVVYVRLPEMASPHSATDCDPARSAWQ